MRTIIVGVSGSGKTTLSKAFARELHKRGRTVAVLDPNHDPEWQGNFITANTTEFNEYLLQNRSVHAFVDEAGKVFSEGRDSTYYWWATRSRHWGHSLTFIGQRYIQIPPTIRVNCTRLYCFATGRKDGMELAEEWNKDVLRAVNTLPKYHFIVCDRFDLFQTMRVTGTDGKVAVANKSDTLRTSPQTAVSDSGSNDDLQNQNPPLKPT